MKKTEPCRSPVIVALDYEKPADALDLVAQLDPQSCRLKVGKQLFTIAGPELVKSLIGQGYDVFLDLKFHDIPNTVACACRAAANMGVWMLNVHASGGRRMMEAAREAVGVQSEAPLLIAVTILTSMTDADLLESGVERGVRQQVDYLAGLVFDCGLDGVVCSAREAPGLKQKFGAEFSLVTPGIRTANSDPGDQRRVMTPGKAIASGANYLVIGRSITGSDNPRKTLQIINREIGVVV